MLSAWGGAAYQPPDDHGSKRPDRRAVIIGLSVIVLAGLTVVLVLVAGPRREDNRAGLGRDERVGLFGDNICTAT